MRPYICHAGSQSHIWLFPTYFGSADIKLDGATLTCDEQEVDYSNGEMLKKNGILVAPCLQDGTEESLLDNDYISTNQPAVLCQFARNFASIKSKRRQVNRYRYLVPEILPRQYMTEKPTNFLWSLYS